MIHFHKQQVELAKRLIDTKSTYDDIKAANDLSEINYMFNIAQPTLEFVNAAEQLNERINREYPEIYEMHKVASGMASNLGIQSKKAYSEYDAVLEDLKSDIFGILLSVLLKHDVVSCVKEFIESVD